MDANRALADPYILITCHLLVEPGETERQEYLKCYKATGVEGTVLAALRIRVFTSVVGGMSGLASAMVPRYTIFRCKICWYLQ